MKDITLKLTKSKDGEGRDSITIQVDDKGAFIPTSIITDFLESKSNHIIVTIPE